jgi:hypothetical protein
MNAENESEPDMQEIMGIMMALAAIEASVTDSDVAEFEKRLYVHQLRDVLFTRLASHRATDLPKRTYRWVN